MKVFWLATCIALSALSGAAAEVKKPWEWSIDQRISERLEPAAITARLRAFSDAKRTKVQPLISRVEGISDPRFVIDGSRNPELFMPWELLERFLIATTTPSDYREKVRETYALAIIEAGWDIREFWRAVDIAAGPFMASRSDLMFDSQPSAQPNANTDSGHERGDVASRGRAFCAARANALDDLYRQLGEPRFDEFLYTTVAPTLTVVADAEFMTANDLARIARGCR